MIYRVLKIFVISALAANLYTQVYAGQTHYGLPGIRNFSRQQYAGGIQNWSFAQSDNGLLYFANNSGLLEYDGTHWVLYQSIKAVNRAVCADGNRIYVGAYNNFGYYEEDQKGVLKYHSLTQLINDKVDDFDEIWRIHKTNFGIVFQSFKAIYIFKDGKIKSIYPRSRFHLSYYVNNVFWVYDDELGLVQYHDGKLNQVPGGDFFIGTNVWAMIPLNDNEVLIGTNKKGVFRYKENKIIPWNAGINEQLKKYQLYSAIRLKNDYLAFGTVQNGIIVSDTAGNLIFELNKERGLQNNTVLGVGQDKKGNIWLCLDNGISMIEFDSPVTYFQNYFNIGTGYASARFGDYVYLGTNQGLFCMAWSDFINSSKSRLYPRLIEGTEGQVWNLTVIDNALFCGHNNGMFLVSGSTATKISSSPGVWNFLKITPGLIMAGTYTGLVMLENQGGAWRLRNAIQGFNESSRFVQIDKAGDIWVSQTYKGIFRLTCDNNWQKAVDVKLLTSKNGLPAEQANLIFGIQSEMLIATMNGIYKFNEKRQSFENEVKFSRYFEKGKPVDYLYEDKERNIWFYADRQLGVLRFQEDGSFKRITIPFSKIATMVIPSFEHINELDPNNVLIGIEGGFANYNAKNNKDYSLPCTIYISELRSGDTSEGVYRYNSSVLKQTVQPKFRYANNRISIAFSANNFELPEVHFQYKLVGFDKDFSEWTTQRFKEYTNLPAGEYTFILHARNNDQVSPSVLSCKFVILPPWYRTRLALIIYVALLLLGIYFAQRYLKLRIKKFNLAEKDRQKEKYNNRLQILKQEALVSEKEMERLRNEKLSLEMIHKEKELANSTMLLIKKNNILTKLQADLRNINSSLGNDDAKNRISSLIKRIEKEIDNEKQWQVFNMHIEQVYEDLFKKLKERCPELSPRELSLCAYLRMNISSKEIATLMNISARGVEISRYRIRKKLHLDREANLTEFMINL